MGRIASNRLRACLYPQGSVVRFRSHHIWQYGIVVDDLGGIWKDKTPLKHEEEMLGIEHGRHRRIMRGNARTILYLRRKRQVTGETPFELAARISLIACFSWSFSSSFKRADSLDVYTSRSTLFNACGAS